MAFSAGCGRRRRGTGRARGGHSLGGVPAPLLFVISALTQYVGAAVAVNLFVRIAPASLAWLRIAVAALVLVVPPVAGAAAWATSAVIQRVRPPHASSLATD